MDDLRRMVIFAHVVETRSFAAAARRLGIARSAVSRHIALLEESTGVRLLNRTTRSMSLTEAGEAYYRSCARILAEAEAATRQLNQLRDAPSGTLKVAGPNGFGIQLALLLSAFAERYPALKLELQLDDHVIDMVEAGIDVSIRIGWLPDSNLIARKLCDSPRLLCASPGYIERHGRPTTPPQLSEHESIIFTLLPTPHRLTLTRSGKAETVQIHGRVKTNSAPAVHAFLLGGMGVAPLSNFMVGEDVRAGRLEQLLPEYDCGSAGVYAVYPERRYLQPKVQVFIEFMQAQLAGWV